MNDLLVLFLKIISCLSVILNMPGCTACSTIAILGFCITNFQAVYFNL